MKGGKKEPFDSSGQGREIFGEGGRMRERDQAMQ